MMVESACELEMDDRELLERRRTRQQRIQRSKKRGTANFLASPYAAIFCMAIALGSILAYWGGVPSWALLALGFGAVLVLIVAMFFLRSKSK